MSLRDQGAALILALMLSGLLAALGISLTVASDAERRLAARAVYSREAAAAAEAGLERAMMDLRWVPSWTGMLNGSQTSSFVDSTRRPVLPAGGSLDLAAATVELQAESASAGNLGANTPVWRLFAWGPMTRLAPQVLDNLEYLVVWIADDPADADGNASADSNGMVMLHGEARGPCGARRAIEATVKRVASGAVQIVSWREVR